MNNDSPPQFCEVMFKIQFMKIVHMKCYKKRRCIAKRNNLYIDSRKRYYKGFSTVLPPRKSFMILKL